MPNAIPGSAVPGRSLVVWFLLAALSVGAAISVTLTDRTRNWPAWLSDFATSIPGRLGRAETRSPDVLREVQRLRDEMLSLRAERLRIMERIAALENQADSTGSVPAAGPSETPAARLGPAETPKAVGSQPGIPSSPRGTGEAVGAGPPDSSESGAASRPDFGVDLGAAPTPDALRVLWAATKVKAPGLFDGLRPVLVLREASGAEKVELRLLAGPIGNAAAASRLCAALTAVAPHCEPAIFGGQRLALH